MFTPGKILTLFALTGACCCGALWAKQEATRPARSPRVKAEVTPVEPLAAAVPAEAEALVSIGDELAEFPELARSYRVVTSGSNSAANQAVKKAVKQYRDAKPDTAERDNARKLVSDGLGKLYDEYLANQEKQIADLEDRLAKLREQVKKRRDAKDKMVELKLELVLSQADGLGWPDSSDSDGTRSDIRWVAPGVGGFGPAVLPPSTPAPAARPVAPATATPR
jgi:hypothetical protein